MLVEEVLGKQVWTRWRPETLSLADFVHCLIKCLKMSAITMSLVMCRLFEALKALLKEIRFDPDPRLLWFAGDLVARGEKLSGCIALY